MRLDTEIVLALGLGVLNAGQVLARTVTVTITTGTCPTSSATVPYGSSTGTLSTLTSTGSNGQTTSVSTAVLSSSDVGPASASSSSMSSLIVGGSSSASSGAATSSVGSSTGSTASTGGATTSSGGTGTSTGGVPAYTYTVSPLPATSSSAGIPLYTPPASSPPSEESTYVGDTGSATTSASGTDTETTAAGYTDTTTDGSGGAGTETSSAGGAETSSSEVGGAETSTTSAGESQPTVGMSSDPCPLGNGTDFAVGANSFTIECEITFSNQNIGSARVGSFFECMQQCLNYIPPTDGLVANLPCLGVTLDLGNVDGDQCIFYGPGYDVDVDAGKVSAFLAGTAGLFSNPGAGTGTEDPPTEDTPTETVTRTGPTFVPDGPNTQPCDDPANNGTIYTDALGKKYEILCDTALGFADEPNTAAATTFEECMERCDNYATAPTGSSSDPPCAGASWNSDTLDCFLEYEGYFVLAGYTGVHAGILQP